MYKLIVAVSIDGVEYEYKVSQFVRWFKIDSFTATCGDKIKSNLKLLDSRDIRDGWISEDGLMDALQIFEDNETLKIFERIIEACDSRYLLLLTEIKVIVPDICLKQKISVITKLKSFMLF